MQNDKYEPPAGPPPVAQPSQVHHDAGPYYPPNTYVDETRGPVPNAYSPAQGPNGIYPPPQGWNQGPGPWPQGPQAYGPGPYGPPQQGMYYQPGPPVGYFDDRRGPSAADGCCAAFLAALTCCCCLDILF
ncbi:uncharacterized protein Z518_01022 [Rhinocladiella mackenziei CBS 650.93]|uniref:Rhinocladiella mackenziei CBS 650.93 unplaced genomic scaffold supercont1.1, whole genome shotgun sequence n=1 Tax=Rhinocladiella mackenziei CBS 650.93 TaxID=1442369 RepID=A0A0D2J2Q3_9EURO|nr:uncharacterized protein Z518_01022 [Rhinocladiella mackenziei CBS 650.93]KIX09941.1 hypothetical protein Z518_01022 [Rhinocladiella mackenziei CBS 650.93]